MVEPVIVWSQRDVRLMQLMRCIFMRSFLGLYANERRPLDGKKRHFSMEMKRWGNVSEDSLKIEKLIRLFRSMCLLH